MLFAFHFHSCHDNLSLCVAHQEKSLPIAGSSGALHAHELLAKAAEKFSPIAWDLMSREGCLERVHHLIAGMKVFLVRVRQGEMLLSNAQIVEHVEMSAPNRLTHTLAMARQAYCLCSRRISRYAAWSFQQVAAQTLVRERLNLPAEDAPKMIKTLNPACLRDSDGDRIYQVVAFKCPHTGVEQVGLVHDVWRGAVAKAKTSKTAGREQLPRKLRVAKGVVHELDLKLCARTKLVVLERISPGHYTCSCLSPTAVLDPLQESCGVQQELPVKRTWVHQKRLRGM